MTLEISVHVVHAGLEAMLFDTAIFDAEVRKPQTHHVNDNRLSARSERAVSIAEYLDLDIGISSR